MPLSLLSTPPRTARIRWGSDPDSGVGAPDAPIVVVDSGLGGLTVGRALRKRLPHEKIVYVGDTARVPYGSKSPAAICSAVVQVVRATLLRIRDDGVARPKHVVIACNSASAVAMPALREAFPDLSISGVIESGARAAARAAGERQRPTIGVIATDATIRSKAYEQALGRRRPRATVLARPTPLLVPLVEEGRTKDDPVVPLVLEQYLRPMIRRAEQINKRLDVLVLGCTHYPLLRSAIADVVGPRTTIVDSADACADDVVARLTSANLLRPAASRRERRLVQVFATDISTRFAKLASRFLGEEITAPELLPLDETPVAPISSTKPLVV